MVERDIQKVKVDIFGEKFTVKGTESEEHVREIAMMLDKKLQAVANRNKLLSTSHVAILAALNLTDELKRLKEDYQNIVRVLNEDKK